MDSHCGNAIPALPWLESCVGLGAGICIVAGLQILPSCSPASEYFQLSPGYQLFGSAWLVPFLTLPEPIFVRAVVVFLLSSTLHMLLEHGGSGCNVAMKCVYSLLCELESVQLLLGGVGRGPQDCVHTVLMDSQSSFRACSPVPSSLTVQGCSLPLNSLQENNLPPLPMQSSP